MIIDQAHLHAGLAVLWQQVEARRAPGGEEVYEDRLAVEDVREVRGEQGVEIARARRRPRELSHVRRHVTTEVELVSAAQLWKLNICHYVLLE